VSEDSGATPAPYVLDVSVLTAITRGDYGIMTFIQGLDASGQPLVIPALAIVGASLDLRSDDTEAILHGLERLESVMIAPLRDAEQAVRLAAVIARTGLGPWDAHVAAVADAAVCPILTLDAARWRDHAADLDEPLHFIEIADPDEAPGGHGPGALGGYAASQPGRRLVCGWSRQPWRRARRQRFRPSLIGMPGWMMCYQRSWAWRGCRPRQ
jgi:predicted nucleic acid-binding protein